MFDATSTATLTTNTALAFLTCGESTRKKMAKWLLATPAGPGMTPSDRTTQVVLISIEHDECFTAAEFSAKNSNMQHTSAYWIRPCDFCKPIALACVSYQHAQVHQFYQSLSRENGCL